MLQLKEKSEESRFSHENHRVWIDLHFVIAVVVCRSLPKSQGDLGYSSPPPIPTPVLMHSCQMTHICGVIRTWDCRAQRHLRHRTSEFDDALST